MTELTRFHPSTNGTPAAYEPAPEPLPGSRLIAWADSLSAAHRIATALCETSFVPKHFQGKPIEAAAALMLGEELGMAPVSALRSIYIIAGTPSLYAKAMVALVQSRGHDVWTDHDTPDRVIVCGQRRGSAHMEKSEWTTARARKAGYTNNKKYETDPQAMLYARAASDVCRKIAADVLAGVPMTVEELQLDEPAPARRVQRAKAEPPPMPEPELVADEPVEAVEVRREALADDLISDAQMKKLHACFNDANITDRTERLRYTSDVLHRHVASSKDLTRAEASQLIDVLEREQTPAEPEPDFE